MALVKQVRAGACLSLTGPDGSTARVIVKKIRAASVEIVLILPASIQVQQEAAPSDQEGSRFRCPA